ncbi:MAG TPA: ACT domain-containing protein [Clostridiales bacterium]|nr:ACT domain-containing protein [Clostridiales bacterium]
MIKQLSVFIENEVGSLAEVTNIIKDNDINIKAIASLDTPEFAILRLVVDKPEKAKKALANKGYVLKMSDAIAVELEDEVGALNNLLNDIAESKFSLNYIYSFILRNGKAPLIVFNTDNMEETVIVLRNKGYLITSLEDA